MSAMEKFMKKSKQKFGEKFNYDNVVYIDRRKPVKIKCVVHDTIFSTNPDSHLHSNCGGCRKCKINNSLNEAKMAFIKKAQYKYDTRFDYSSIQYIGARKPINLKCVLHDHSFSICPTAHLKSEFGGCKKCDHQNKLQKFINRSIKKYGDRYNIDKNSYSICAKKVTMTCNIHNYLFRITPSNHIHLNNGGCVYCSGSDYTVRKNKFLQQCSIKFNNKYDYSNINFKSIDEKIIIKCKRHDHLFSATPRLHLKSTNGCCDICDLADRCNNFVNRSIKKYGNRFIIHKESYVNSKTTVDVTCVKHHYKFSILVTSHFILKNGGCKYCNKKDTQSIKKSFLKKCIKKFTDKFDYTKMNFVSMDNDITITCKQHDLEFNINTMKHLYSKYGGCRYCNKMSYANIKNKFFTQCIEKFKDHYDYSKAKYISLNKTITVKCNKHNCQFAIAAKNHYYSKYGGCKYCIQNSIKEQKKTYASNYTKN